MNFAFKMMNFVKLFTTLGDDYVLEGTSNGKFLWFWVTVLGD